jgi:D-sedoheptulose 7-phosphate isomerase
MEGTLKIWKTALLDGKALLSNFLEDEGQLQRCEKFTQLLVSCVKEGGNIFACGNGGSHCDAMHFAEEFTGKFRKDRRPLGALALGDASHLTCVGNDYGFDHVFSRQLTGLGRKGDLLVALTTSGKSKNILNALNAAKEIGMKTVALLGRDGGFTKDIADVSILIPGKTSDRIQEMHIKLLHTVIESAEAQLFPENT